MEILLQLGANKTAFIQFAIFIISISFLTKFVYGPYFRAYDQRLKQTKGADQVASETQAEVKKIEAIYKMRAREINEKLRTIFDFTKKEAGDSGAFILNQAKVVATETAEKARKEIATQRAVAEKDVMNISQDLAKDLVKKLTGAV